MRARAKVEGFAEIKRRLREVSAEMTDRPIKSGLRSAGKVLKKAIVAAAPYDKQTPDDGVHIREDIVVGRSRRASGPGKEVFTVGVKYGRSEYKDTALNQRLKRVGRKFKTEGAAWYWKLIEFGTSRIKKKSFIRPAFEASQDGMRKALFRAMRSALTRLERKGR